MDEKGTYLIALHLTCVTSLVKLKSTFRLENELNVSVRTSGTTRALMSKPTTHSFSIDGTLQPPHPTDY